MRGSTVSGVPLLLHPLATAPQILSWLTTMMVFRNSSPVLRCVLKCIEVLLPPLLFSTPMDNGLEHPNTGCPLSAKLFIRVSAVAFVPFPTGFVGQAPIPLFFISWSEKSTSSSGKMLVQAATRVEFCSQKSSLLRPWSQPMSFYIDMKMIKPVN